MAEENNEEKLMEYVKKQRIKIKKLETALASNKSSYEELQGQCESQQKRITELETGSCSAAADGEKEDFQQKIASYEAQIAEYESKLVAERGVHESSLSSHQLEVNKFEEQIAEYESKLVAERGVHESSLSIHQLEVNKFEEQIAEYEIKFVAERGLQESEKESFRVQLLDVEATLQSQTLENSSIAAEFKTKESVFMSEIDTLKERLDSLVKESAVSVEATTFATTTATENKGDKKKKGRKTVKDVPKEPSTDPATCSSCSNLNEEKTKIIDSHSTELNEIREQHIEELQRANAEIASLEQQLQQCEIRCSAKLTLDKEVDVGNRQLEELTVEHNRLLVQEQNYAEEISNLKDRLLTQSTVKSEELLESNAEKNILIEKQVKLDQKLKQLEENYSTLSSSHISEVSALKAEHNSALSMCEQKHVDALELFKHESDENVKNLRMSLSLSHAEELDILKEDMERLHGDKMAQCVSVQKHSTGVADEMEQRIKVLTATADELQVALDNSKKEIVCLESNISVLEAEAVKNGIVLADMRQSHADTLNASDAELQGSVDNSKRELVALESKMSLLMSQKEDDLEKCKARHKDVMAAKMGEYNIASDTKNNEILDLKSKISELETDIVQKNSEFTQTQAESDKKLEAMIEKSRKLKALLNKTRNAVLEKEGALARVDQERNERPVQFDMLCRMCVTQFVEDVSGLSSSVSDSNLDSVVSDSVDLSMDIKGDMRDVIWCCVTYSNREGGLAKASVDDTVGSVKDSDLNNVVKWMKEDDVKMWVKEGSKLSSKEWPALFQDIMQSEISKVTLKCENEVAVLQQHLSETTKQFQEYKNRAQVALKRVGVDERERGHVQSQQIEELKLQVEAAIKENELLLEKHNGVSFSLIELQQKNDETEVALDEKVAECVQLASSLSNSAEQVSELEDEVGILRQTVETLSAAAEKLQADIETKGGQTPHPFQNLLTIDTGGGPAVPPVTTVAAAEGVTISESVVPDAHSSASEEQVQLPNPVDTVGGQGLFFTAQAEQDIRKVVAELRRENNKLTQSEAALSLVVSKQLEQVVELNNKYSDLEMEMGREKEFNAANRRINAEYLVNILKKFLMTSVLSERSKLVPVLCSILHLSPEDTAAITQKWHNEVQNAGGIGSGAYVRWLLPTSSSGNGSASNDPADAIGNLDIY